MAPGAALGEHTETGDLPPGRDDTGRPLRARRMLGGSRGSHHSHSPEADCIVTWATLKTREPTHCMVAGHGHRTRKPQSRDQTQVCPTPAATFSGRGFVCQAPGAPPRLALAGTRAASRWGGSSRRCGLYLESHQGAWEETLRSRRPSLGVRSRAEGCAKARWGCRAPTGADMSSVSVLRHAQQVRHRGTEMRQRELQVGGPEGPRHAAGPTPALSAGWETGVSRSTGPRPRPRAPRPLRLPEPGATSQLRILRSVNNSDDEDDDDASRIPEEPTEQADTGPLG